MWLENVARADIFSPRLKRRVRKSSQLLSGLCGFTQWAVGGLGEECKNRIEARRTFCSVQKEQFKLVSRTNVNYTVRMVDGNDDVAPEKLVQGRER